MCAAQPAPHTLRKKTASYATAGVVQVVVREAGVGVGGRDALPVVGRPSATVARLAAASAKRSMVARASTTVHVGSTRVWCSRWIACSGQLQASLQPTVVGRMHVAGKVASGKTPFGYFASLKREVTPVFDF